MRADEWDAITEAVARTVREVRTVLGWSQQELAVLATTSQGTISRLESANHGDAPFKSIVAVLQVLGQGVRNLDVPVSDTAAALLAFVHTVNPGLHITATLDADFLALVQLFHSIPPPRRPHLLHLVRSSLELCEAVAR